MHKRLICFITTLSLVFVFIVPLNSSAYVSSGSLYYGYHYKNDNSDNFIFSFDGLLLVQCFLGSNYDPSIVKSIDFLDSSKFSSGIWQGQDVSILESSYLYKQDSITSFISPSYCSSQNFFVYSLMICIPVKSGDNFRIFFSKNSSVCSFSSYCYYSSFIPNCTGLRNVYKSSFNCERSFEYSLKSSNQHIVSVFNPLYVYFNSDSIGSVYSFPCLTANNVNLIHAKTYYTFSDCYITPFNAEKDTNISLQIKSDKSDCIFSVYEIITTDSEETEEPTTTTTSSSGSGGTGSDDETSKNIFDTLKNVFSKLKEIGENIANLPQNIANGVGNFFTDLKNTVTTGFESIKQDFSDVLKYLFVPSENNLMEIRDVIETKFKFIYQILDFGKSLINANFLSSPPDSNITIYGKTVSFMNWELYDNYKPFIDLVIIVISYYFYIQRLIKRIPGIIGGFYR